MTSHAAVIDYFAILGQQKQPAGGGVPLVHTPLRSSFSDDPKETSTASDILNEAITDIAILPNDQVPDATWSLVDTSIEGHQVDPPFLAIRRQVDSHRLDYIIDIKVVMSNDEIPKGYDLVFSPLAGLESSSILCRGYLIIKRAIHSPMRLLRADPIVDDISLLKRSAHEELPEGYEEVDVIGGSSRDREGTFSGRNAVDINVVFHVRAGVGLCNLSFESRVIDRYPPSDSEGLQLPLFAFPSGMSLSLVRADVFPAPSPCSFFSFVCTDEHGKHFYVACLQFMEELLPADVLALLHEVYGSGEEVQLLENYKVFCPKVICVVSQWPFYRAMRQFLRQIYSLSHSSLSTQCPLECFISSVVGVVPCPVEGGRPLHVVMDAALVSRGSKSMQPVCFHVPYGRSFPLMDYDFAGPLRCFSVEVVLAVFTLMLREAKLLFICKSNHILTEAMETLRALLFPLSWGSCFVPRLPADLLGLLQAPGGFMIGAHVPAAKYKYAGIYLKELHSKRALVPGTYVVDLTGNSLYQYTRKGMLHFDVVQPEDVYCELPFAPRCRLHAALKKIAIEFKIGPQSTSLDELDSVMEVGTRASITDKEASVDKWESFPTLPLRDSFMVFMIDFLGDYIQCIIPPPSPSPHPSASASVDLEMDSYRTFQEEFRIKEYLDGFSGGSSRGGGVMVMELLLETQMFSALLQRRAEGRQQSLVFFEEAASLLRDLGLSAARSSTVLELPVPIHDLLAASTYWNSLPALRQQQLKAFAVTADSASSRPVSIVSSSSAPSASKHTVMHINTGSLGSRTAAAPSGTIHPVPSSRLDDLLTMCDFIYSSQQYRETMSISSDHTAILKARDEINAPMDDLHLSNCSFGPLVLPGPTGVIRTQLLEADDDEEEGDQQVFCREGCWSTLSSTHLQLGREFVHPRVWDIRQFRNTQQSVSEDVGLLIRSAGERLSFEQHGKLLNPVLGISAGDQVCCVISYAIDVVSIVLTLTAIRTLHSPHHDHDHDPARDVFQSMGILAQVEQWELLGVLSDTVWRGLLMGCANAGGGVLMRQASCVIYQCLLSLRSCPADSLTYGLYVRALSSKERKSKHRSVDRTASGPTSDPTSGMNSSRRPLCLDYSLHLEDTGMEWFYQRLQASHGRGNPSTELHADLESAAHASRGAPKRLSIRSNSSPPPPSRSPPLSLTRRAEAKSEQVLKQSIAKFGLTSPEGGVLSFKRPASSVGLYPTMVVQESGCDAELYPEAQHVASDIDALLDQLHRDAARPIPTPSSSANTSIKVDPIEELILPSPPPLVESASTGDESADSPQQQQPQPVPVGAQQSSFASLKQRFFGGSNSNSKSNARKGPEPLSTAAAASGSTPSSSSSSSSSSSWTSKVSQAFFKKSVQAPDSCDEKTAAVIAQPGAHKKPRISVIKLAAATQSFEDEDVEEENEEASDDDGSAIDPADDGDGGDDGGGAVVHSSSSSTGEASATSELDGSKAAPDVSEHQLSADIDAAVAEETAAEISKSAIEPLKDEHASAADDADDKSSDDDADGLIASASAATITSGDLNTILSPEDDSIHSPELSGAVDSAVGHNEREATDCDGDMGGTADGATSSSSTTVSFSAVTSNAEEPVLAEEPPPAVSPPLIDVVAVHEKLLDLFSGIAQRRGSVVGISCCTPCPHCRHSMTEEDILSGWCAGSGYDDHVKGNPRSRLARNMTAIHQVTCRQCSEHFSPRLTIGVYSSCEGAGGAVQCSQLETVPFMSPFGVRFELEQLLSTEGDKVVIFADQLRDRHPAVYWGVQWYSARLNMPCSMLAPVSSPEMMSGPPVCELPVVIGWRECVVRANASKVLSGLDSEPLRIADVFPECSAEDVQYLKTEVAGRLDGSAHNMRSAMLRYSECASVVHRWAADGFSSARTIHIGLLSLCYIENRRDMISIPKTSSKLLRSNNMHSLAILSKDSPFEKVFVEAVLNVLSESDCAAMLTTREELLACSVKGQMAAVVRNSFGFLL